MNNKKFKNHQTKIKQKQSKTSVLDFKFSNLFTANYRLITAVLILLPLLVYVQVYNFELVWDDGKESVGGHLSNPFLSDLSWQNFTQLFSEQFFGMYIPISYLFWGILKTLAELLSLPVNSVLHLSNVVVHIVNGLLVFTILKQFVVNKWAVLIGVLFFLLHPIQVETVAWVSEFRGLLATCFALLSLYYYLKQKTRAPTGSLVFFILAVLSKPSAVVLVLFVFSINYFHYQFKLGKNIEKTLPYVLIALMAVVVAHWVQFKVDAAGVDFTPHMLAYWQRPFAWFDSIVFYLTKIIYPYYLSASYTLSPKFISAQWWFYPLALVPLALGALLWFKRNSQPLLIFAFALFIAGFFTTSGFVDFAFQRYSLVADRYVYFAMVGIALLVATIFSKTNKKAWKGLIISILVIFVCLSAFRQIPVWQNTPTLWSHSVNYEVTPKYAHSILGKHFNKKAFELGGQGKYKQAITYLDKAIKHHPKYSTIALGESFSNKGAYLFQQKKYQEALIEFDKAIKVNIKDTGTHDKKIHTLILLKQCQQAQIATTLAQDNNIKLHQAVLKNLRIQCLNQ